MNTLAPFVLIMLLVACVTAVVRPGRLIVSFDKDATLPLRGVLALLVVLGHLDNLLEHGTSVITWIHWATPAVNVFFFMSGFGCQKAVMQSPDYLKGFVGRTAIKLFVPCLMCSVIYVFWKSFLGEQVWEGALVAICKGETPFLPYSWFVFMLLFYSAVFWLCNVVAKGRWATVWQVASIASSYCLLRWGLDWETHLWWSGWSFSVGVVWSNYESRIREALQSATSIFFGWAFASYFFVSLLTYLLPSHTPIISELPYACLGPVCYLLICFWGTIHGHVLKWLGREAYEIYLLHGVFLLCLKPLPMGNLEWGLISVFGTIVFAQPVHWASGQIIKFLRK